MVLPARTTALASCVFAWLGALVVVQECRLVRAADLPTLGEQRATGQKLFEHVWTTKDQRSHAGDGLGPVYNASSCAACHHLHGIGGGGPTSSNVVLLQVPDLSPFWNDERSRPKFDFDGKQHLSTTIGKALTDVHPDLGSARSIVIHQYGVSNEHEDFRLLALALGRPALGSPPMAFAVTRSSIRLPTGVEKPLPLHLQKRMAEFDDIWNDVMFADAHGHVAVLALSQRNPPALFGAGQINSIPDHVIEEAALQTFPAFPEIAGRVSQLGYGRIGRFGWKAQFAHLRDVVAAECAIQLGLNTPQHAQVVPSWQPTYVPPGRDLTAEDYSALLEFVQTLPSPTLHQPAPRPSLPLHELTPLVQALDDHSASYRRMAVLRLAAIGPAAEVAKPPLMRLLEDELGSIRNAAAQALIAIEPGQAAQLFERIGCAACHQPRLGDVRGIYSDLLLHDMGATAAKSVRANEHEWRTPPLWGCSHSAPYLHDGRAETLEEAIQMHTGEAQEIARRYRELPRSQKLLLLAFLSSL